MVNDYNDIFEIVTCIWKEFVGSIVPDKEIKNAESN